MGYQSMKVPSGATYHNVDLNLMTALARVLFITWSDEPRTLASGLKSHVYVQGREDLTENPDVMELVCHKILHDTKKIMDAADDPRCPRFIGIPHVAYGWTPALVMVDNHERITGRVTTNSIMRSALKGHSERRGKWLAGKPDKLKFRDIVFDNVVTSNGSMEEGVEHLEEDGFKRGELDGMVFVDRQQGGFQRMQKMGLRHSHACYNLLDMAFAFQKLGEWPSDAAERVEREIRTNQIAA
jgi:orotate phosphoribosyltransferase